jgi:hypothetical protein
MAVKRRTEQELHHALANKRFAAEAYEQLATNTMREQATNGEVTVRTTGVPLADAVLSFALRMAELNAWMELIEGRLAELAEEFIPPPRKRRRRSDTGQ